MSEQSKGGYVAKVIRNESVSSSCHIIQFEKPPHFPEALPGQFLSVRLLDDRFPLLRRPYSIFDLTDEEITLLVKVAGSGSSLIAGLERGETVDLIGPLGGTTFTYPGNENALFVAGGTGLAPIHFASRFWRREGRPVRSYLLYGASDEDELLTELIGTEFSTVHFATLDGSKGFHGDVVALCEELLSKGQIPKDYCYSCGPRGMVEALVERVGEQLGQHETSLESIMACGVGACRGCTVPMFEGGHITPKAVCSDGTVFRAGEIAWKQWVE